MPVSLEETRTEILRALHADRLVAEGDTPSVEPLSGGVSCDVFRVELPQGPVCVKKALARLRVAAEWLAPVERVHNEVAWLRFAARSIRAACRRSLPKTATPISSS